MNARNRAQAPNCTKEKRQPKRDGKQPLTLPAKRPLTLPAKRPQSRWPLRYSRGRRRAAEGQAGITNPCAFRRAHAWFSRPRMVSQPGSRGTKWEAKQSAGATARRHSTHHLTAPPRSPILPSSPSARLSPPRRRPAAAPTRSPARTHGEHAYPRLDPAPRSDRSIVRVLVGA